MRKIILILLVVIIFVFINKPLETMSVNLNCKKYKNNYICKEKTSFSSITTNLNEILNYYKESGQKKYSDFKKKHDKAKNDLEDHFGKIKL